LRGEGKNFDIRSTMHRPPLDIIGPVVMCCAMLLWIGRRLSWTQRLAAATVTLAVIIVVVWVERSGF
jgi:hypothetical protein